MLVSEEVLGDLALQVRPHPLEGLRLIREILAFVRHMSPCRLGRPAHVAGGQLTVGEREVDGAVLDHLLEGLAIAVSESSMEQLERHGVATHAP